MNGIRTVDIFLVSDADEQVARRDDYFEQLFKVNSPSAHLQNTGLHMVDTDLPINKAASPIDEVKETMTKADGICNIGIAQSWKRGHDSWVACCLD